MLWGGIAVPFYVRTWPLYYLAYAKKYVPTVSRFLPPDPELIMRDSTRLKIRPVTFDRIYIVSEIWLLHDYDLSGHDIERNDVVIDLGAHIGAFSVYAAKKGAQVTSYEPFPDSYELLQENIVNNRLNRRIKTYQLAVSALRGTQQFFVDPENPGANSTILKTKTPISVKSITLADVFQDNKIGHCDLLKCDIEGAEYELFYTAPNDIFTQIDKIYLEWHVLDNVSTHNPDSLQSFLEEKGYTVRRRFTCLYATK
jgi:FkbM family methyltransferase